jgi:hypothetical protein
MLKQIMENEPSAIAVSIVLGIGCACLFKQVCKGNDCFIVRGPSVKEIAKKVYKIDEKCYTYTPEATKCSSQNDK